MEKIEVRRAVLAQMKNQDKAIKAEKDLQLLQAFLATESYQKSQVIATYLAFDFEYNTDLLIQAALADGKTIVVPKTYPQGRMIFVAYDPDDLVKTKFGLSEPASDAAVSKSAIDLIHVPGVAFNAAGFRIGYGGGYYDRYLSDFQGDTLSTIYDFQRCHFQENAHDIAVQEVLSR